MAHLGHLGSLKLKSQTETTLKLIQTSHETINKTKSTSLKTLN